MADVPIWTAPLNGDAPGELIGRTVKAKNDVTINRFPPFDVSRIDGDGVPYRADK